MKINRANAQLEMNINKQIKTKTKYKLE